MTKKYLFFIIVSFTTVTLAAGKAKFPATEVIDFQLQTLPTQEKRGFCWVRSLAAKRADAWRCITNNVIYDPCFTSKVADTLVCNVDPADNKYGFLLRLQQPLPQSTRLKGKKNDAWVIELQDGLLCRPYTGTARIVNYKGKVIEVQYGCASLGDELVGLLRGSIKPGKVWQAKQVVYKVIDAKKKVVTTKVVSIKRVWR